MKFTDGLDILGFGFGNRADRAQILSNADFRKATVKMQLASLSIESAIDSLAKSHAEPILENREEIGFILNSGFGELEATLGFLKNLSETGVARPLLFQNSLHNSTLGFCAIRFGLTGASMTMNHRVFGGEYALQTAFSLIHSAECRVGLVTTVETIPEEFLKLSGSCIEGATSLIVADSNWSRQRGFTPYARLDSVQCRSIPSSREKSSEFAYAPMYEFDAVRSIALALTGIAESKSKEWAIEKPFGGFSMIALL